MTRLWKNQERLQRVAGLLKENGAVSQVFSKVVPDPTIDVVTQGIEEMQAFAPDTVIALGVVLP